MERRVSTVISRGQLSEFDFASPVPLIVVRMQDQADAFRSKLCTGLMPRSRVVRLRISAALLVALFPATFL